MNKVFYHKKFYKIYSLEEAKKQKIDFCFWREIKEKRKDWVLTDDNYVIPVLRSRKVGLREIFVTPFGTFDPQYKHTLRFSEDSWEKDNPFWKPGLKSRLTLNKRLFVKWYLILGDEVEAYRKAYKCKRITAKKYGKRLLKKREVLELLSKELKDAFEKAGIDETYLLKKLKEIAEDNKAPVYGRISALEKLIDLIGMKEKKTLINDRPPLLSPEEMKALEEQKQRNILSAGEKVDISDVQVVESNDGTDK